MLPERNIRFELEYDEENNFARMGADLVDDEWVKAAIAYHQPAPRGTRSKHRRNKMLRVVSLTGKVAPEARCLRGHR
jgi:hypothetical protein